MPTEPSYVAPVHVAKETSADSCWVKHEEEREGRKEANRRMIAFRDWYRSVKKNYSEGRP